MKWQDVLSVIAVVSLVIAICVLIFLAIFHPGILGNT